MIIHNKVETMYTLHSISCTRREKWYVVEAGGGVPGCAPLFSVTNMGGGGGYDTTVNLVLNCVIKFRTVYCVCNVVKHREREVA